jgi:hypothetical protein
VKCEECGAPHGEWVEKWGERVKVARQSDRHDNHAARGRELCQDCAGWFQREANYGQGL